MSFKTIEEKVTFLNKLCKGTLGMTHYTDWELNSYMFGSLFCFDGVIGHVFGETLTECIDEAVRLVWEAISNG